MSSTPAFLDSWIPGQTPMSTWPTVITAILSYLVIIFGLREFMTDRPALKVKAILRIYNAFLSLASLVLLALEMEEVARLWFSVGMYNALCASASWTSRLESCYIINYYLKYIVLLDTIYLVLGKRPISFLHVFHHSTTVLLGFVGLKARISGSWVASSINLGEHVMMYYYYFTAMNGTNIWWKKYVTMMQILQFIVFILVGSFGLYQHFAFRYLPYLPHIGDCAGDPKITIYGMILIVIFLVLFSKFYARTYTRTGKDRSGEEKDTCPSDEQ